MRTTFTLDDDAAALAQHYAKARALRLGQAVSELIRRASAPPVAIRQRGQAWVFELPPDAPRVTATRCRPSARAAWSATGKSATLGC